MLQAHYDRAAHAVAPLRHQETERCAAMPEAGLLQRRQLIEAGKDKQPRCQPSRFAHDHRRQHGARLQGPLRAGGERGKPDPHEEIGAREDQRPRNRLPGRRIAALHGIECQDHGRRRGQHHGDHHACPHGDHGHRRFPRPCGIERHHRPDERMRHVERHPGDERPACNEDKSDCGPEFGLTKKPADDRVHRRALPDAWVPDDPSPDEEATASRSPLCRIAIRQR